MTPCNYIFRHGRNVSFGLTKHRGLSLEKRVKRSRAHTCTYGPMLAISSLQTTRDNHDSRWLLIIVASSITIPVQLAESRNEVVRVSKCEYQIRYIYAY